MLRMERHSQTDAIHIPVFFTCDHTPIGRWWSYYCNLKAINWNKCFSWRMT